MAGVNNNSQQSVHLPQEIIEVILSRLPVKSLLKFQCVSKSWRCLIDSEQFIKSHLENSRENACFLDHSVIFYCDGLQQCHLQALLNGASFEAVKDLPAIEYVSVVGTFSGLVCLLVNSCFIMWNPSTRMYKRLPEPDAVTNGKVVRHCGMGWFESSGEYKILAVLGGCGLEHVGEVYSSKTKSWNTVRPEGSKMIFVEKVGLFLNGKLHWLDWYEDFDTVVSFDLKSGVFGMIQLPHLPELGGSWTLGVLGGELCALSDHWFCAEQCVCRENVNVWAMKEYGVKDSWRKLEPPFPASASAPAPAPAPDQEGEVVVFLGRVFMVYYPEAKMLHYVRYGIPSYCELLLCMETLVSPIFKL